VGTGVYLSAANNSIIDAAWTRGLSVVGAIKALGVSFQSTVPIPGI